MFLDQKHFPDNTRQYLNKIPVARGLDDLVGDLAARPSEQDHLSAKHYLEPEQTCKDKSIVKHWDTALRGLV